MKSGLGKAVIAGVSRAVSLVRMVIRPPKPAEKEVQKLWTYLKVFSITYAPVPGGDNTAVKVFANGRQQIPLRIVLSAWNDDGQGHEEYVHLTKETLDQLRLVNYIDGTHVLMHEGWFATFVQNEYTYDASVISDALLPGSVVLDQRLPPAPVAADQVYRDIYVSVDHVETMRMAAEIAPPSKPAIQTRPGVSGGGPNSFDSSVTIVGRPTLEAVVSPGPGYDGFNLKGVKRSENDAVRVNDYYVSLIYRQRPVRLFSLQYDAAGPNIWWANGDLGAVGRRVHPDEPARYRFGDRTRPPCKSRRQSEPVAQHIQVLSHSAHVRATSGRAASGVGIVQGEFAFCQFVGRRCGRQDHGEANRHR